MAERRRRQKTAEIEPVLDEVVHAFLEDAARKTSLRRWPRATGPAPIPVEASRDDEDGSLGVFRFFTIVADKPRAGWELTPEQARRTVPGLDDVQLGDDVGLELPLPRLSAVALADIEATLAGRDDLLPLRLREMLQSEELRDSIAARLATLRGTPPHAPLRELIVALGTQRVAWTAASGGPSPELCVLIDGGDEQRLVVIPARQSLGGSAELLTALAPQVPEQSLWRFLETEGVRLIAGEAGALWSAEILGRRLSLEVKDVVIATDPAIWGQARAHCRLLVWAGEHVTEDSSDVVALPLDVARAFLSAPPDAAGRARLEEAARGLRNQLAHRLTALVEDRSPTPTDALGGTAFLRILARAATGGVPHASDEAVSSLVLDEDVGEEAGIVLPAGDQTLVLFPGDDVVALRFPEREVEVFSAGALVDGDVGLWRALASLLARAIREHGADISLEFAECDPPRASQLLSEWVQALGKGAQGRFRWPPRPGAVDAALALHRFADRFVDDGPDVAEALQRLGITRR